MSALTRLARLTPRKSRRQPAFRAAALEQLETRTVPTALTLKVMPSGGPTLIIPDGGPSDSDPNPGAIRFAGSLAGFRLSVTAVLSQPSTPSPAEITISQSEVASSAGGTLTIEASDTGYLFSPSTGTALLSSQIGGTGIGAITTYQSYADSSNTLFGTSGPTVTTSGLQGPFTTTPFSGSATANF